MELTIPAELKQSVGALPHMLVEPSMTVYIEDGAVDRDTLIQHVSMACLEHEILSFRLDGEIIDVVEILAVVGE